VKKGVNARVEEEWKMTFGFFRALDPEQVKAWIGRLRPPAPPVFKPLLSYLPLFLVVAAVSMAAPAQAASPAPNAPIPLRVVWSFAHDGLVRFCYDQSPAVIYFEYDRTRKVTSIRKKELNGDERVIAEFPGTRDEISLSCSQDGQTIAATGDAEQKSIFLMHGASTALYTVPVWVLANVGDYSLLAPDGKTIRLPKGVTRVAGTDLLRDMKVFPEVEDAVFLMDDYAYVDGESSVHKYGYVEGDWKQLREIKRSPDFGLREVVRCGSHDVASLVGDDSYSAMVLDEAFSLKQDWLARIGARNLFRKYEVPPRITGYDNGACTFPLLRRSSRQPTVVGLARMDANGLQLFSLPVSEVPLGDDHVYFNKDGCYALMDVGQEIQLLHAELPRCQ
jgi:hypothetical protein